jgi:hypothetical protein
MGKASSTPSGDRLPVVPESTCSKESTSFPECGVSDTSSFPRNQTSSSLAKMTESGQPPCLRDVPTTEIFSKVRLSKLQQMSTSCLIPHSLDNMSERNTINSASFDWETSGLDTLLECKGQTREEINMKTLKAMRANKTDIKGWKTHGGRTALMVSVLAQDFEFVKILVTEGHNVSEKTITGETALELAKNLPSKEIYNFLLQSIG